MTTNEDLARLHLETAVRLMGRAFVEQWLSQSQQGPVDAPAPASAAQPKSTRGRKPGAAPAETRCAWNAGTDHHCKNTRHEGNSYCRIHLGKVHLIDPGQ